MISEGWLDENVGGCGREQISFSYENYAIPVN
jgi:hypothetical protein